MKALLLEAATQLRIAYYERALAHIGGSHPDAPAILLHLRALRDSLRHHRGLWV